MSWEDSLKEKKRCPCCGGTGVQYNEKDGYRHLCPACQGRGVIRK